LRVGVVAVLILMLVVGAAVGGFYLGNSGPRSLTTIVASTSLTFTIDNFEGP